MSQAFLNKYKPTRTIPLVESPSQIQESTTTTKQSTTKESTTTKQSTTKQSISKPIVNPFFEIVSDDASQLPKKRRLSVKIAPSQSLFEKDDLQFQIVQMNSSSAIPLSSHTNDIPLSSPTIEKPKTICYSSKHGRQTQWDLQLWIDACIPSSWTALECFALQHIDQMDIQERSQKAKPQELTSKVMQSLETSIQNWKKGIHKVHCLMGAPSTGKTLLLKLLADKYNFEFNPVHEDDSSELKLVLQNGGSVSLENKPNLWVIEHFDFFDKSCKALIRNSFKKLLQTGPVFLTMYPTMDQRGLENFIVSSCVTWNFLGKMLYLENFGPPSIEWENAYQEGNGELTKILSFQQYNRTSKESLSENLCGNPLCKGTCLLCTKKRKIPCNLRLIVEDTLCPRTSARKEAMLSESDADLSLMLLQEMIPFTETSLQNTLKCLDSISLLDCATEYSTFMKDAFIGGTLQKICRSSNINFASKCNIEIPEMLFGKHRRNDSQKEKAIGEYRGVKNYICRKRGSEKEDETEEGKEFLMGEPQVDTRDLFDDYDLFRQASGIQTKNAEKKSKEIKKSDTKKIT